MMSRTITEKQGGIWSPTAYKVFVSSLLKTFEDRKVGAHLGSLYCGIPTVADDVTLVSNDPNELQVLLNVQSSFANKQRFIISTKKSCVLQNGCDKDQCGLLIMRHLKLLLVLHIWVYNGTITQSLESRKLYPVVFKLHVELSIDKMP